MNGIDDFFQDKSGSWWITIRNGNEIYTRPAGQQEQNLLEKLSVAIIRAEVAEAKVERLEVALLRLGTGILERIAGMR